MAERILVAKVARALRAGGGEPYAFPDSAEPVIRELLEASAAGPDAAAEIGGVLKLVRVLERDHGSPAAARWLAAVVKRSPAAMEVVVRAWSREAPPRPPTGTPRVGALLRGSFGRKA